MMDNLTANKSRRACQSQAVRNGWPTTLTQGPSLNLLPTSQHLNLGSSCDQRPSYDHLQASSQSCMGDLSTLSSRNTLHSALYKGPHSSNNPSSNMLFANTAIPCDSHMISSFAQQIPHTSSMLLTANQGKNIPPPSLPQTNQASKPCRSQHLPLFSPHDPYKASFQPPLTNQGVPNGVQDQPISLPSCGPHEQRQWIPSSPCRGTVNESVPDAAAHLNKEPTQEGNTAPPTSNEKFRSALLHHRAQLRQQLSELDKLLKSIPPDDSSDGQSPHTAIEKTENSSAESEEDADLDDLDHSDDDLSYVPHESSSDESSHSTSSTDTDKRPSLPRKKRAKAGSSLSKAESVCPPKKTTNQKKSSETVVSPCSNSKAQRVYDRRNYCVFCSKPMSKMARHLERIHSDKAEVAAAFQYPKNSKERQKIWNRLTNQGNFAHNKNVLKTGKGQLAARQRPRQTGKAQDFLHCLYCRGLYLRKALHRHMRLCPEKVKNENESQIGRKRIALRCFLEASEDLGITDGFKSVLSQMTYDHVAEAIMDDKVILQFGELLFKQHGSDVKRHEHIRQNLRQLARLVLEAQKITPLKKLEDFFLPSSFPHVVSAVNVLAGYDPEKKSYSIPSLAIKLGYHLQKACSIVEGNAVECGDESLAESARKFLSVYQKKWNKLISAGALTTLRVTKLNTAKKVPLAQDVKRLNFHMENVHVVAEKKLRESPSAENYAALAKVILARTILFNRRRAGEVSSVQLTAFMSRKTSNLHAGMDISMSDLERTMCGFFTRVDIRGKCGRMVPVLLKPSFVSAMELLLKVRETCGVPSKNPFLFGRPNALSAYSGSECIQKYVKACGAQDPETLTSTKSGSITQQCYR
ncbi:uncharacterized protein LOC119891248 [Micropterus salmoides]|uniref:uncharacterized protein LOC119891248 n=1 Tax=Micropterus salmoides TaxID=27706 RepID=UPI0018EDBF5D|nr:uncharacterized protein LOC119891248 [Micropterus salmoides]XP_038558614.1 uncharacterized protein LOC119891248 [Micropterus salmoides]